MVRHCFRFLLWITILRQGFLTESLLLNTFSSCPAEHAKRNCFISFAGGLCGCYFRLEPPLFHVLLHRNHGIRLVSWRIGHDIVFCGIRFQQLFSGWSARSFAILGCDDSCGGVHSGSFPLPNPVQTKDACWQHGKYVDYLCKGRERSHISTPDDFTWVYLFSMLLVLFQVIHVSAWKFHWVVQNSACVWATQLFSRVSTYRPLAERLLLLRCRYCF